MPNGVGVMRLTPTLIQTGVGGAAGLIVGSTESQQPQTAAVLTVGGLIAGIGLALVGPGGDVMSDVANGLAAGSGALLGRKLGRGEPILGAGRRAVGGGNRTAVGGGNRTAVGAGRPRAALQISGGRSADEDTTIVTRI